MLEPNNETEIWQVRIEQLKSLNTNFKKLLQSAMNMTSKSGKDDVEYYKKTLKMLESENAELEKKFSSTNSSGQIFQVETKLRINEIERENSDLRMKLQVVLEDTKTEEEEIKQLQIEHAELMELLKHNNDEKSSEIKNFLHLEETGNIDELNNCLFKERVKLHKKIFNLKTDKMKLMQNSELINNTDSEILNSINKSESLSTGNIPLETTSLVKEQYQKKFSQLEEERSALLKELQTVSEFSRNQIADEYGNLLKIISKMDVERVALKDNLRCVVDSVTEVIKSKHGEHCKGKSIKENNSSCNCLEEVRCAYDLKVKMGTTQTQMCVLL